MNRVIWHWIAITILLTMCVAGFLVSIIIDRQVENIISEQVSLIQEGTQQRFRTFDELLRLNETKLDEHIKKVLPEITKRLQTRSSDLKSWNPEELRQMADEFKVNEIYIIDRNTRIISTSFLPDLDFELGSISNDLRAFLNSVYAQNNLIVDRFTLSSNTGIINKYAYLSPKGSDYIFEISVELKPFLAKEYSQNYVNFLFRDLFTDLMGNELLLESIDLFLVNQLVALPFDGQSKSIDRAQFPDIPKGEVVERSIGNRLEYFIRIELKDTLLGGHSEYMAIRTRFDASEAHTLALQLILANTGVLTLCVFVLYIVINFILQRTVIERVQVLNDHLGNISAGDYDSKCDVGGSDELTSISRHINQMSGILAQRQKDLNLAYETLEEKVADRTHDLQQEIEKRIAAEKELNILATTDPLTKLPNRRLIDHYLKRALAESQRNGTITAVLFLDLDNFKYVNDSMGHGAGDVLIKTIASRLTSTIRTSDTAGRLGGDEFVVLLQGLEADRTATAQHVQTIAEKILDAVRLPIPLGDHVHHCTMSIGITLSNDHASAEAMYKQADTAMYRAKEQGKDHFCFYEETMQHLADARLQMEKNLREAIKTKVFTLHYQPQIDSTGRLLGAEALIRWQKSNGDFVPPDVFIPIAEEIGLIGPIGDQVLHQACQDLKHWLANGLDLPHVSVNISAKQFHQDNFVDFVLGIVDEYELHPSRLVLEITETAMLGNREEIVLKMKTLREKGFAVSIDDFGTGYSSLNYLKDLPIDQLKIDKSFIQGIGHYDDDKAIVNMIISMAVHLRVDLIAEGVEDKHQYYYLKQNGCHTYQGYFFGRPMPADKFTEFANARNVATTSTAI